MDEGTSKYGIVRSRLSAHWYDRNDGSPKHDHNLRQARRYGHYPSVTTVLKVWPKPALDRWKMEQLALAALTLPKKDGEELDAFAKRIVDDSESEVRAAGDIGRVIHEAIACRLVTGEWPDNAALKPFFGIWEEWLANEIVSVFVSERSFVHPKFGYGGTLDLGAKTRSYGTAIIDFKNKAVKNGKPFWADEWLFQLVAYQDMLAYQEDMPDFDSLISVVVDRETPCPPYVHVWEDHKHDWGWKCFRACQALWTLHKGYDPMTWEPPVGKRRSGQTEMTL